MQNVKKFFEAHWFTVLVVLIVLALASLSGIRSYRERQKQEKYEKDRQEIINQQKPLIEQSQLAQKDAAVSAAISQEKTNEIAELQKQIFTLRVRFATAATKASIAGTIPTAGDYRADLDELRRLCERANSLAVQCDLSKFSDY